MLEEIGKESLNKPDKPKQVRWHGVFVLQKDGGTSSRLGAPIVFARGNAALIFLSVSLEAHKRLFSQQSLLDVILAAYRKVPPQLHVHEEKLRLLSKSGYEKICVAHLRLKSTAENLFMWCSSCKKKADKVSTPATQH